MASEKLKTDHMYRRICKCASCDGDGGYHLACFECEGRGEEFSDDGKLLFFCGACRCRGKIWYACGSCHGSGRQNKQILELENRVKALESFIQELQR